VSKMGKKSNVLEGHVEGHRPRGPKKGLGGDGYCKLIARSSSPSLSKPRKKGRVLSGDRRCRIRGGRKSRDLGRDLASAGGKLPEDNFEISIRKRGPEMSNEKGAPMLLDKEERYPLMPPKRVGSFFRGEIMLRLLNRTTEGGEDPALLIRGERGSSTIPPDSKVFGNAFMPSDTSDLSNTTGELLK